MNKKLLLGICIFIAVSLMVAAGAQAQTNLTPIEELGEFLYFDTNLSEPNGQACASCHEPGAGFVDPDSNIPVSEGVISGLFGGRNSPMSAYAMYAPTFYFDDVEGLWIGGQFWDGRATGWNLGDPLADQALGPFLNPVEMANPSKQTVIDDVAASEYADLFKQVWGKNSLKNVEKAYDRVALSIAAFERTGLFGQFTSKYDAYLSDCLDDEGTNKDDCAQGIGPAAEVAGKIFSKQEWAGLQLFMGERAMCSACHVADWIVDPGNVYVPDWAPDGFVPPVFTDFTYDNLGVPKSTHPLLRDNPVDLGLGATAVVNNPGDYGKFKVMPLRNIADTAPYAHNGYFTTLSKITEFYNTRDVKNWPDPEYPLTINESELGDLGLDGDEEVLLVKFMKTLSDGYQR